MFKLRSRCDIYTVDCLSARPFLRLDMSGLNSKTRRAVLCNFVELLFISIDMRFLSIIINFIFYVSELWGFILKKG